MKENKCQCPYCQQFKSEHKFIVNGRFEKPFVGKAVCGPADDFSQEKGEYVSKLRAHIKYQNTMCKIQEKELENMLDEYKEKREKLFNRADKLDRLYLRLKVARGE